MHFIRYERKYMSQIGIYISEKYAFATEDPICTKKTVMNAFVEINIRVPNPNTFKDGEWLIIDDHGKFYKNLEYLTDKI